MIIKKDSFVPQYHQLKKILLNQIRSGRFKLEDKIPSESQLCREYNISKITTGKAISELVMENILRREQGRGTFVVNKKKRTGLIGVVLQGETATASMFFSSIIQGIDDVLNLNSYHQIVKFSGHTAQKENECLHELLSIDIDGIILCINQPSDSIKNIEFLIKEKIPFVLIDKYIPELDTDYVVFDHFKMGYIATEYLIKLGHKKIAFILSRFNDFSSVMENLDGYRTALKENVLDIDTYVVGSRENQTDYQAIQKLLDMKNPPTGIVTYNVNEVENALRARNLKIPDDISVIRYGKYKNHYDTYTYVDSFTKKMASQAAGILVNKVEDIEIEERNQIKIKPVLVEGNSVAEFRKAANKIQDLAGE